MKISFIIPTYNTLELTKQCFESLAATVDLAAHETIVIDDGSTDGTREYLATLPKHFKIVLNPENQGYGRNCNQAARMAEGELLCLCNSDLVFLPGWLPPMVEGFQKLKRPGIIGNVQRYARSRLTDHVGVRFHPDGRPLHIGIDRHYEPVRPYLKVSAVTAACCMIRKDLFLEYGGFDDVFRNGFEDTDLCLRLLSAGYDHYVASRSTVLHHVSSSPGRKNCEDENLKHFLGRWQPTAMKISFLEERKWKILETLLDCPPFFRYFLYLQPFIRCF